MKVTMLLPRNEVEGEYAETVAIFAARRCRTTKTFEELWGEVAVYSPEKRRNFLSSVVFEDWAADVLEMIHLVFDWEDVPVWLIIELLRHRLLAREFSLEQLSQRAIQPFKLRVEAPTPELQVLVDDFIQEAQRIGAEGGVPPEKLREVFPQGVLVNLCIAGNLRAFQHFWWMRSSKDFQGKGGAHPKFMALADEMQRQALKVLPITTNVILKA